MAKQATKASRVIGYIRVSTDKQADEGHSLAAQEAKLRAYAEAMEVQLVAVVTDAGLSAKSLDRPGLASALARLEAGEADGLLVTKLDRLTRSVRDLGTLLETYFADRFALLSVADSIDTRSAGGRLVLNVLMSVAQWEREATSERTRDVLAHLRANGVQLGAPRLEGPAVARIQALRAEGLSLGGIAATMTSEGYTTLKGGRWAAETVRKVLRRAA